MPRCRRVCRVSGSDRTKSKRNARAGCTSLDAVVFLTYSRNRPGLEIERLDAPKLEVLCRGRRRTRTATAPVAEMNNGGSDTCRFPPTRSSKRQALHRAGFVEIVLRREIAQTKEVPPCGLCLRGDGTRGAGRAASVRAARANARADRLARPTVSWSISARTCASRALSSSFGLSGSTGESRDIQARPNRIRSELLQPVPADGRRKCNRPCCSGEAWYERFSARHGVGLVELQRQVHRLQMFARLRRAASRGRRRRTAPAS